MIFDFADGVAASRSKKKRKIHTPRLVKPPRIYGGVASNPEIDWVDVGLAAVSILPIGGRLFTLGGKLLRKTIQATKVTQKATKAVTKGIQTSGKTRHVVASNHFTN